MGCMCAHVHRNGYLMWPRVSRGLGGGWCLGRVTRRGGNASGTGRGTWDGCVPTQPWEYITRKAMSLLLMYRSHTTRFARLGPSWQHRSYHTGNVSYYDGHFGSISELRYAHRVYVSTVHRSHAPQPSRRRVSHRHNTLI